MKNGKDTSTPNPLLNKLFVSFPFTPQELSKNRAFIPKMRMTKKGRKMYVGKSEESKQIKESIFYTIRSKLNETGMVFKPKVRTHLDIMVYKVNPRFDAVNIVDVLFDAIEQAILVNDCYFSTNIDWIMADSYKIDLTILQPQN